MAKKKIILVDDNKTFLEGLTSLFQENEKYMIIGQYSSGDQLLENESWLEADLILLDIEMPGKSGVETGKQINFINHNLDLIAITMYQDKVYLKQLIEAGFKGFINKTQVGEDLFQVIEAVLNNNFQFPDDLELL